MSAKTLTLNDATYRYLLDHSLRDASVDRRLRQQTQAMTEGNMQISPEQGQFMALLVEMLSVHKAIEIGTFTGYSALQIARSLPDDGRLVACDVSEEWTNTARQYWTEAGVDHKIDLRIAPALETLDALIADGQSATFDFAFIDADKANYLQYYERCITLLRAGGVVAIDNVLWSGDVADPSITDVDTEAIRALNTYVHADDRVTLSMVPIGDGLTLARKRD